MIGEHAAIVATPLLGPDGERRGGEPPHEHMVDSRAERARNGNFNFENIFATIYRFLGIDSKATLLDFSGRPQYLLNDPVPIHDLF